MDSLPIGSEDSASDVQAMSDADLRRRYLATDGEAGDPIADALLAEIERRNLDI